MYYQPSLISFSFIVDREKAHNFSQKMSSEFPNTKFETVEFEHSSGQRLIGDSGDFVQVKMEFEDTTVFKDDSDFSLCGETFIKKLGEGQSIVKAIEQMFNPFKEIDGDLILDFGKSAVEKRAEFQRTLIEKVEVAFEKVRNDLVFPLRRRAHHPKSGVWSFLTFSMIEH